MFGFGSQTEHHELVRVTVRFFKKGDVLKPKSYKWFLNSEGSVWFADGKPLQECFTLLDNFYWDGKQPMTFATDAAHFKFSPLPLPGVHKWVESDLEHDVTEMSEWDTFHEGTPALYAIAERRYQQEKRRRSDIPSRIVFYAVYSYTWETYNHAEGTEYDCFSSLVGEFDWSAISRSVVSADDPA